MKKVVTLPMLLVLLLLCGCNGEGENNSATRFVLDTVATITADCDNDTLDGAFELCTEYENKLSRTIKDSDVYKLNEATDFIKVSDDTLKIIERSIDYSDRTEGKFDITICPVSLLWDFEGGVLPNRDEIAAALQNVDYHSISIDKDRVNLNGKKIDLGGIAKGYIADRIKDYFLDNGVDSGIINLGGNVLVFGKEETVGIQKPFKKKETIASFVLKDKTAVTSGIYQRYIEKDGVIYHHILDTKTGYGVENELASVTVIGNCSFDCDALSTCCMLLGTEKGIQLIEDTEDTEAVFVSRNGDITLTSGLYRENDSILFK